MGGLVHGGPEEALVSHSSGCVVERLWGVHSSSCNSGFPGGLEGSGCTSFELLCDIMFSIAARAQPRGPVLTCKTNYVVSHERSALETTPTQRQELFQFLLRRSYLQQCTWAGNCAVGRYGTELALGNQITGNEIDAIC